MTNEITNPSNPWTNNQQIHDFLRIIIASMYILEIECLHQDDLHHADINRTI